MESTCDLQQRHSVGCDGEYGGQLQQYMGTLIVQHIKSTPPEMKNRTFEMPHLRCSFPALLHPQYEEVKEKCDGWIVDVAQPPSAAARQLLLDCVLPRLICRDIPSAAASVERLVHVTKMVAWLTIADDEDDHPDAFGTDYVATTHNTAQVLSILRRPPAAEAAAAASIAALRQDHDQNASMATMIPSAPTHLIPASSARDIVQPASSVQRGNKREAALVALAALWAEMQREMSPILCSRFVSAMEDYFDAMKVQAAYRRTNRLPDVQAYTMIRRHASFILPCFVLLEYALNIELDDATYSNALIQEFRNAATDYICLCNDLVSCNVEIGVGDYFNMPSIVYRAADHHHADSEKEWTLQSAVNCVADMAQDLDARCVSMLQTILDHLQIQQAVDVAAGSSSTSPSLFNEPQLVIIRTYLSGLCSCMSGSLAWYLETPRYN